MTQHNLISRSIGSPTITSWLNLSAKSMAIFFLIPLVNLNFTELDRFVWFSLATVWSIILVLDLGINPIVTRYFSYLMGKKGLFDIIPNNIEMNEGDIHAFVALIQRFYRIIIVFIIALLLPLFYLSVYEKIQTSEKLIEFIVLYFGCASICIVYLRSNVFNGIIQGLGHLPKVQITQFWVALTSIILSSLAIFLTESLLWTVIGFYCPYLIYFFLIRRIATTLISENFPNNDHNIFVNVKTQLARRLLEDFFKSGVGILASQGFVLGSAMLVNKIGSIQGATNYMMCLQFVRAISSYSQVPFYSKIPVFCKYYAAGKVLELNRAMTKGFTISLAIYVAMVSFVGLVASNSIGGKLFGAGFEINMWLIFGFAFLFERIGSTLIQVYTVTGDVKWHIANSGVALFSIAMVLLIRESINEYMFLISLMLSYLLFLVPYGSYLVYRKSYIQLDALTYIPYILLAALALAFALVAIRLPSFY